MTALVRQETPNSEIWESALANLSLMVTAKSEISEFIPLKPGNFSKGDAQSQTMSFSVRPITATGLNPAIGMHFSTGR
jgi:hypothetical protein